MPFGGTVGAPFNKNISLTVGAPFNKNISLSTLRPHAWGPYLGGSVFLSCCLVAVLMGGGGGGGSELKSRIL